jgi:hypothetical protein
MIFFPLINRTKKATRRKQPRESISVDQTGKKHRDAIARLFPVDQTEKYEREPISSSLIQLDYQLF